MTQNLDSIAKALQDSGELKGYVGQSDPIEHEVAYDVSDIVESMDLILGKYWPEIINPASPEKVSEALFEIREQLRHILYHIESSAYFSLICAPKNPD
jgi:hypothetical protein